MTRPWGPHIWKFATTAAVSSDAVFVEDGSQPGSSCGCRLRKHSPAGHITRCTEAVVHSFLT